MLDPSAQVMVYPRTKLQFPAALNCPKGSLPEDLCLWSQAVKTQAVAEMFSKNSALFEHFFNRDELKIYHTHDDQAAWLTKSWLIKTLAVDALKERGYAITANQIQLTHTPLGAPQLKLSCDALLQAHPLHISLTDEAEYVGAMIGFKSSRLCEFERSTQLVGVGVDLVMQARLGRLYQRSPSHLQKKILNPLEQQNFLSCEDKPRFLAIAWAMKEAVVKALGIGFTQGVGFKDIFLKPQHQAGVYEICYQGVAADLMHERDIQQALLAVQSLGPFIQCTVVLTTQST